ncbi:MAG: hypothetical protein ACI87E_002602 [Mariniblastus sp.]|jgi:hypothetical protein
MNPKLSSLRPLVYVTTLASVLAFQMFFAWPSLATGQSGARQVIPPTDPLRQTQTRDEQPQQAKQPGVPKQDKDLEIPKPENMYLETSDGVKLRCTYLAAPKLAPGAEKVDPNQKPVPFILLHDWEGNRNDLAGYAKYLQRLGHAVILPDLRGHGGSTVVSVQGRAVDIDVAKFQRNEVLTAVKDIERCKKFLVQQHNKGELNIDLLCVVAVGKTSVLAVRWTLSDWVAFPPYNSQGIKQGQDVKALMLISPTKKLAGASLLPSLKSPLFSGAGGPALPMLVMWSASDENAKESESISKALEKMRPDFGEIEDTKERMEKMDFFSVPVTKSQFTGQEMIQKQQVANFWPYITNLLFERKVVAKSAGFPWVSREAPEDEDE